MSMKADERPPGASAKTEWTARDDQQARVLAILARHAGQPVTFAELKDAGIELPASVVSEIELAGIEIERCQSAGPGGTTRSAVRLLRAANTTVAGPAVSAVTLPTVSETPARAGRRIGSPGPKRQASGPPPPARRDRRWGRPRLLAPLALLGATGLIMAVVVAALVGGRGRTTAGAPQSSRATAAASTPGSSTRGYTGRPQSLTPNFPKSRARSRHHAPPAATPSPPATTSQPPPPTTARATAPPTSAPVVSRSAGAGSPQAAVQGFYEAAAQHRYPSAWAMADPNMRAELGSYAGFENEMTPVRAIAFHQLQTLQTSSDSATIAVQTTSVQTDVTQQCSGTVRTVQLAGAWLLDGISIHCD